MHLFDLKAKQKSKDLLCINYKWTLEPNVTLGAQRGTHSSLPVSVKRV